MTSELSQHVSDSCLPHLPQHPAYAGQKSLGNDVQSLLLLFCKYLQGRADTEDGGSFVL